MEAKVQSYPFLENIRTPARGSATARVIEALREAIVSLELAPGSMIDKAALCDRLGISRFPVSEALSRLQSEGLVEILPQKGTIVSLIRLSDAHENMFVRRSLEAEAVRELAKKIDEPTLTALRRNLRYQKAAVEAGDRQGFHKLDLEFRKVVHKLADDGDRSILRIAYTKNDFEFRIVLDAVAAKAVVDVRVRAA